MLLAIFTFGAPLIILFFIIKQDQFKEPNSNIIKVFIIGILLAIPACILNDLFVSDGQAYIAGITEESLKYLAFIIFVSKMQAFNERMDAIVYGTLISLGFATIENYFYVYGNLSEETSYVTALLRLFSAIPLHALCGVIMGYYLGIYYFTKAKNCYFFGLIAPMSVHGVYNYLCEYHASFLTLYLILVFYYANRLHKEFKFHQDTKAREEEVKP